MKKNKKVMTIRTKRLVLVPLSDDELRQRIEAEPDDGMRQALGEMLSGCEAHPDRRLWCTEWQVRLKDTGETVGSLGFKGPPNAAGEVEIGCGIHEAFRCRGYAAEAAKALIDWAFSQAEGLFYIMAETSPENIASQKVLEKLQFKSTGRMGEEGPLFELEPPPTAWVSVFLCLGMSVGLCFGMSLDNKGVGMCIGMAIGVALGMALDADDKKKRAQRKAERAALNDKDVP